eukprot:COSAG02_NODE_93_length_37477_cov_78.101129_19_plen_206_part_00
MHGFVGDVSEGFCRFRMVNLLADPVLNCRGYVVRGVNPACVEIRLEVEVIVVSGPDRVGKVVGGRAVEAVEVPGKALTGSVLRTTAERQRHGRGSSLEPATSGRRAPDSHTRVPFAVRRRVPSSLLTRSLRSAGCQLAMRPDIGNIRCTVLPVGSTILTHLFQTVSDGEQVELQIVRRAVNDHSVVLTEGVRVATAEQRRARGGA